MDRLRRAQGDRNARITHRGGTKPGSLLKSQIPIRTFAEWSDKRPGFTEIDLVQHDGGNPSGIFACTLTVTDVSTGWTEIEAVRNKARRMCSAPSSTSANASPSPYSASTPTMAPSSSTIILRRYCEQEEITFTRGRVGRKNDNPFVEQKNWSVVRRLVGYDRYDTGSRSINSMNSMRPYNCTSITSSPRPS